MPLEVQVSITTIVPVVPRNREVEKRIADLRANHILARRPLIVDQLPVANVFLSFIGKRVEEDGVAVGVDNRRVR